MPLYVFYRLLVIMTHFSQSIVCRLLGRSSPFQISTRFRRAKPRRIVGTYENEEKYIQHLEELKKKRKQKKKEPDIKKVETEDTSEFDYYSNVPLDILNLKFDKPNPAKVGAFSKMMLNMKSKNYRDRHSSCLLEGKFLIADAMKTGLFVRLLYFSRLSNLVGLPIDILKKTNLVKVSLGEIQQASEVKVQSHGLLAVASKQDEITRNKLIKQREEYAKEKKEMILPLTLICDNIRDAGNMGALLRTAAAAGCEQVLATKGCVDIWDPRVIRAGAGAHFKIPIIPGLEWDEVRENMDNFDIRDVYLSSPTQKKSKLSDILPNFQARNQFYKNISSNLEDDEQSDHDITKLFSDVTLHSLPYYDITFSPHGHSVVVVGSETLGMSEDAYLFSVEASFKANPKIQKLYNLVNIPMSFGSECLNTAVAGSILLYEARRQILDT